VITSPGYAVYSGNAIGLTSLAPGVCLPKQQPRGDQSVVSNDYRDRALDYMRDHAGRVPIVILARVGRNWSLFAPPTSSRPAKAKVDRDG
jgi:hypothetical protein